jgi:hypothetical protein
MKRNGKSEEALLPDFLQTTLEARQEDSNENIAVASFPNEPAVDIRSDDSVCIPLV